jgi:DNA repair protein RadC
MPAPVDDSHSNDQPPPATGENPASAPSRLDPTKLESVADDVRSSVQERYLRYLPVIQSVADQSEFELEHIKEAVRPELPGFVTRVVNELVQQGWLLRHDGAEAFCWNRTRGPFCPQRWLDDKLLGSQVKNQPQQERPRERLMNVGVEELRLAELLAILIRSGRPGESAVEAGEKLARHFQTRLDRLPNAGRLELKSLSPAIDVTAYCQIMAGIELGRRIAALAGMQPRLRINSTQEAIDFCQQSFRRLAEDRKQEEFHIVTLDTKNQVINTHQITVGTLDSSLVHPREVFRAAIRDAAAVILLVHNHPSGDPTPSRADLAVTERLVQAGEHIGIKVLDHIILGNPTALSLRATGQM